MQQWRAIPVAIGGVAAVGDYNWYQGDPAFIRRPSAEGVRLIRADGLWGGNLDQSTTDGWTCHRVDGGAVLSADGQPDFRIEDSEEYRAQGFSPGGGAFVYATSPTIHLATRRT
jgi:hypothetical protein